MNTDKSFLLDTNIFDELLKLKMTHEHLYNSIKKFELYTTWYQIDELEKIPDETKRVSLLEIQKDLNIKITKDVAIFDFYLDAEFVSDEQYQIYENIRYKFGTSNPDSRAAVISLVYDSVLITNDGAGKNKGLIQACKETIPNFKVINFGEFLELLK